MAAVMTERTEIRRAFELPGGWVSAADADVIRWPSGSSHPCVLAREGTYLSCCRGHSHVPGATIPSCLSERPLQPRLLSMLT